MATLFNSGRRERERENQKERVESEAFTDLILTTGPEWEESFPGTARFIMPPMFTQVVSEKSAGDRVHVTQHLIMNTKPKGHTHKHTPTHACPSCYRCRLYLS